MYGRLYVITRLNFGVNLTVHQVYLKFNAEIPRRVLVSQILNHLDPVTFVRFFEMSLKWIKNKLNTERVFQYI